MKLQVSGTTTAALDVTETQGRRIRYGAEAFVAGVFNQTINNFDGASDAETSVLFTLTNNSGTWASAADVLTANGQGFDAAAHVICLTGSGCENALGEGTPLTFFVAEGGSAAVPDPGSMRCS